MITRASLTIGDRLGTDWVEAGRFPFERPWGDNLMLKEFRDFALRGNVVDLAIGVIIGAAFGKIVTSMVEDLIMPVIGYLTGGIDFSKMAFVIQRATTDAAGAAVPEVAIRYGAFINTLVQFIIIAFVLFMVIKAMNSVLKKKEEAPAPVAPTRSEELLVEIRDALKAR
jgi:large conductance mechanosensitive channel